MRKLVARAGLAALPVLAIVPAASPAAADSDAFGPWEPATRVEAAPGTDPEFNGGALDGCPFLARDGKTFFMASNRPGGIGGIDIWISTRASVNDTWGAPVNAGRPVNSEHNDFCPTISRDGHQLYFVSNRPGFCGGDDIFVTRRRPSGWDEPVNLGCSVDGGPNSAANEASPFPIPEPGAGPVLYLSSTRAGNSDIYRTESHGDAFGPATAVAELNTADQDGHPNLRRDGLEIFFFSNRPGSAGNDIYAATRPNTSAPWSEPVNLGPSVNSSASETRPSLSWDGSTLYFGSNRPGGEGDSDHYVTTRA